MSRNARSRKWKQRRGIIPSLGSWSGPTDRELFLASLPAVEIKTHSPTLEEVRAQQRELLDMLGLESVYEDGSIRYVPVAQAMSGKTGFARDTEVRARLLDVDRALGKPDGTSAALATRAIKGPYYTLRELLEAVSEETGWSREALSGQPGQLLRSDGREVPRCGLCGRRAAECLSFESCLKAQASGSLGDLALHRRALLANLGTLVVLGDEPAPDWHSQATDPEVPTQDQLHKRDEENERAMDEFLRATQVPEATGRTSACCMSPDEIMQAITTGDEEHERRVCEEHGIDYDAFADVAAQPSEPPVYVWNERFEIPASIKVPIEGADEENKR